MEGARSGEEITAQAPVNVAEEIGPSGGKDQAEGGKNKPAIQHVIVAGYDRCRCENHKQQGHHLERQKGEVGRITVIAPQMPEQHWRAESEINRPADDNCKNRDQGPEGQPGEHEWPANQRQAESDRINEIAVGVGDRWGEYQGLHFWSFLF